MKKKLIRMLIALALMITAVEVGSLQAEASIITPVQTSGNGLWGVDYWWEINTDTNNAKLYSKAYQGGGDVTILIYPPEEGNVFWYNSDNFYDVTVPLNWSKDYSPGIGGRTDILGAGINWIGWGPGAAKDFVHYSSGLFDSPTINGGINTTWGKSYNFSINVPSQLVGTTVVPEPISSMLFATGGMLLAGRKYFGRKS